VFRGSHGTRLSQKYEMSMCAQSLRYLKSKYLLFFLAQSVSRHLGKDVSEDYVGILV
jgi:hypothetical protein